MKRVQLVAIGWAGAGAALVLVVVPFGSFGLLGLSGLSGMLGVPGGTVVLPPAGWAVTTAYLLVSNALLVRGLRRRRSERFGPANIVTSLRSTVVGLITGLVVASFAGAAVPVPLLIGLVTPALTLDAVDGWVARRTRSTSELGARFDMEVDAFLLLVLSVRVAPELGVWVLAIGALRYAFVAAGWLLPWMRARLPYRYWRKVVTAYAGIALAVAAAGVLPGLGAALVAGALVLLGESFGRDALWLVRARSVPAGAGDLAEQGVVVSTKE